MMVVPAGVKVHLALGRTDMRKGMDGLATMVQETLKKDPFSGHLFAFRGRKADIIKILSGMETGCVSSPRDSITGTSSGRECTKRAAP